METVRERIAWVLANTLDPATGATWADMKALSVAAGLGEAHIGMVIRGTIGEPRSPTLKKIAAAARVSLTWLSAGAGSPTDGVEGAAALAARVKAAALAPTMDGLAAGQGWVIVRTERRPGAGVSVDDEAGALCVGDASDDRIARTLAAEVLRDAGAEVRAGAVEALAKALLAAVTNL